MALGQIYDDDDDTDNFSYWKYKASNLGKGLS